MSIKFVNKICGLDRSSNIRECLDLGHSFFYSEKGLDGGRSGMGHTHDEITQNLAERWCWQVARRDLPRGLLGHRDSTVSRWRNLSNSFVHEPFRV